MKPTGTGDVNAVLDAWERWGGHGPMLLVFLALLSPLALGVWLLGAFTGPV